MADRGRDFKFSILSDTDRFELDKPADALNKLGVEALDAARDLDKLYDKAHAGDLDVVGKDAKAAGDDLDKLGKDAQTTASKVDSAFEKIASSSKSNLRKVGDSTREAKKGMDDVKDEAHQSGREAAASFSGGFDGIVDFVQETAANAFGGFGPIGAAAGIAAAAGIGFFVNKIQEGKQRVDELTAKFVDLRKQGIDPATDAASHLTDELDAAELRAYADDARKLGINLGVVKDALDGNAGAQKIVNDAIADYNRKALEQANGQKVPLNQFAGLTDRLNETKTAYENSAVAAEYNSQQTDKATESVSAYNAVSDEAIRKGQALVEAHDSTAQAVKDVADADDEVTQKIAENGQVKIGAVTKVLREQTKAAQAFTKNLQTVQQQGDDEFTAWIAQQGPEMAQAWVSGSKGQRDALYAAWKANVGAQMGKGTAAGLTGEQTTIRDAAGNLYTVAKDKLTGQAIVIPVHVALKTQGPGSAAAAEEAARRALSRPIVVPVNFVANPIWRAVP